MVSKDPMPRLLLAEWPRRPVASDFEAWRSLGVGRSALSDARTASQLVASNLAARCPTNSDRASPTRCAQRQWRFPPIGYGYGPNGRTPGVGAAPFCGAAANGQLRKEIIRRSRSGLPPRGTPECHGDGLKGNAIRAACVLAQRAAQADILREFDDSFSGPIARAGPLGGASQTSCSDD